ncbi:CheR family methyltransferase [Skermanella aerolata]|uniref:CheR family methyltransferase n=1 Tax=Skermanella aerolata TaxID=393310 RepID=UPI003D1BDB93
MADNPNQPGKSVDSQSKSAGSVQPSDRDEAVAQPDDVPDRTNLIVGVGASAGGIDAFKAFFSKMPADSGMAFVLIQHLDPHHESSLVAIIAGYTSMPVHLAEDAMEVHPNQVHVIPPNAIMTIRGGTLHLSRPAPPSARRTSIDTFLTSLAEDQGENAIGIILSGFGSDGALGVAAIKEHGGLTLSQAEFDHHAKSGMPRSAAAGGFVDHVLAVEDMPGALIDYRHHRAIYDAAKGPDGIRQDLPSYLAAICTVLRGRLGRDFSQYKSGTLMRRIQRRMHVLQADSVPAYIEQLRSQPHEAECLFRELLISVTRFFRDAEAFGVLEASIIPGLLTDPHSTEPIRIWVAGCATGEEAYSVAILVREGLTRTGCRRPVQIFATDIDDQAIETARMGLYAGTIAADLSIERLERNFVKEDGNYRVTRDIREMCLFSVHDLVKDPPFSKLDLITCRNLLIYFTPLLQQRVLTTFHYALKPGCHLFLGLSEGVAGQSRLFEPIDKRHRIFQRQETAVRLPAFPLSPAQDRSPATRPAVSRSENDIDRRAARAMARYAPAYLVVDRQHDVLRFSGQTVKYLEPATGVASLNLFTLLHPDLRATVRAALKRAAATGEQVLHDTVSPAAGEEAIRVIVEPLADAGEGDLFVVAFQSVERIQLVQQNTSASDAKAEGQAAAEVLNRELQTTRERLRNTTEELEAANEELQSSNEEYLSVNEELQSTNEELETSKEELQSLNEELQTINAELNNRNDSLVRSNSDLANLFDSTAIATLFLDSDLRIRRFTPRLLEIFKLREGDEGRPISDIVSRLSRDGLEHDVRQVLRSLIPVEREVALAGDGTSYLMRVQPYRDLNNVIDGAVVTFIDITERRRHEQARSLLAAIVESSQDAIISFDLDSVVTSWNAGAERLYGYNASTAIGQSMTKLLPGTLPDDWEHLLTRLEAGERIAHFDSTRSGGNGRSVDVSITISPVMEGGGRITGASLVARDVSERKAAERRTALLLSELDHRVKNILAIVSAVVSQTLKTSITPEAFAAKLEGRIKAIAKAHSLLTREGHGEMSLRTMIVTELAPYDRGEGNVEIDCPDVALSPNAGLAMAMAVHELASNAAKYGALSTTTGRLRVKGEIATGPKYSTLTLTWMEIDGPPVQPPTRRGFGTTLIERTLAHELDAEVNREFLEAGLRCTVTIPLTEEIGRIRNAAEAGGLPDDNP